MPKGKADFLLLPPLLYPQGYYVEKDQVATKEFLGRKIEMVETNLANLQNLLENNRQNMMTLTSVMQKRIADIDEPRRKENKR